MKLTKKITLEQFAIAVATELKKHDIDVVQVDVISPGLPIPKEPK